jgi:hypothetical protein
MKSVSRTIRLAMLPLVGTVTAVGLFLALYNLLHLGALTFTAPPNLAAAKAEGAKLLWGASAFSFAFVLLWNAVTAVIIVRSSLSEYSRKVAVSVWSAFGVINIIGLPLVYYFNFGGGAGDSLIELIRVRAQVPIKELTGAGNLLTFMTVSAIVISVCCLAAPVTNLDVDSVSKKVKLFVWSLYSAAALLVIGLFEIYALFRWGAVVSGNEVVWGITADALAVSAGAVFTVLLVAIYAPAAMIQHRWLDLLIEIESTQSKDLDVPKWLAAHGLSSSPLTIGTAMLAPLVTGALTNIIKVFA